MGLDGLDPLSKRGPFPTINPKPWNPRMCMSRRATSKLCDCMYSNTASRSNLRMFARIPSRSGSRFVRFRASVARDKASLSTSHATAPGARRRQMECVADVDSCEIGSSQMHSGNHQFKDSGGSSRCRRPRRRVA
ncbi:hypothetical protein EVAR_37346_1 [Eumeta japonica]|uniref:Uncharacterized protein n=1 Tax=Eumeta variegata TaxID=151549 RepID=A0A4C1WY27_EUMVA|nr:hypothetical protein EVAR_37346_1 [Eumeta japonica]